MILVGPLSDSTVRNPACQRSTRRKEISRKSQILTKYILQVTKVNTNHPPYVFRVDEVEGSSPSIGCLSSKTDHTLTDGHWSVFDFVLLDNF